MAKINFIYRGTKDIGKLSVRLIHGKGIDYRVGTNMISKKKYWFRRTTKNGKTVNKHLQLKEISTINASQSLKNHKSNLIKAQEAILELFHQDFNNGMPITKEWLKNAADKFSRSLTTQDKINTETTKIKIKETDYAKRIEKIREANLLSNAISKMFVKYKTNPNELKKYKVTHNLLSKYQTDLGRIYTIKDLNQDFANNFMNWAHLDMKYSKSYTNAQLKRFRSSAVKAYEADEDDIIQVSKTLRTFTMFDKIYKDKIVIFLNYEELDKIDHKVIEKPNLADAKKALLIGCETGLRYSDMNKLIDTNIKNVNGVNYWKFRTEKTDTLVQITVSNRILYLIEKYGLPQTNYPNNGVKLNEDIKKVCAIAEINEIVKGKKSTIVSINGKNEIRNIIDRYPKHDLITSRTFRRSFATNYYGKIDTALITSITGHSTEQQLKSYINLNDESNILRTKKQIDEFHQNRTKEKNNIKLTIIPKTGNQ
ncbi:tyrosine-type recombinase/integrase [Cellulophaga baltica]|uniref:tyrosine-type recombinase/integrase n=1 Tax=Cellulophaga baltica TaxID=76594 RepID=UPI002493F5F2|nr:tyrosine-type recombinase/integrase [Cellulophaga baltica]